MPAPSLLPEQRARYEAGLCACGCGEALPYDGSRPWLKLSEPSVCWASDACRQRGHRQRIKAGAVVSVEARRRRRLVQEAEDHERQASALDLHAAELRRAAADHRTRAAAIYESLGGQLPLFTPVEVPSEAEHAS